MQMGNICCKFLWWSGKRSLSSQFWRMACQSRPELECVLVHFHNEAKKSLSESGWSNAAGGSPSPHRGSRCTSRLQTGSDQGGSSHGFKTFLSICCSTTCAHQPNLQLCMTQNPSPKDACWAEHGILLCLLHKTFSALFAAIFSSFSSPASHWCFLKARKKRKPKPNKPKPNKPKPKQTMKKPPCLLIAVSAVAAGTRQASCGH